MSRLIDTLRSLFGMTPFGGTMMLPTGKEEYPVALQNEINGGHHGFNSLEDLAQVPTGFLSVPMLASVKEHTRPDGSTFKTTTFRLEKMPPQKISDIPGYDISLYWKVIAQEQDFSGAVETRYAPNYQNKRPFFREPDISLARYNAGYASNTDNTIIWSPTYDATVPHVWQSQRNGSTSDWGIPVQILSENYSAGDFLDVIFKWVAKGAAAPARPVSKVNSEPNNHPEGWSNVPPIPAGETYETYSTTNDLYRSSATKDVYQDVKGGWSMPLKVTSDPNLVRYGNQPTSKDFLNTEGTNTWKPYFTPGLDTHMATRPDTLSNWTITQIDGESGEYTDFVFKAFPASYVVTAADTPTEPSPYGDTAPNNCKDAPYEPAEDEVLYVSRSKKLSNGAFKTPWSFFYRFDGADRIQAVIEPVEGYVFKKSKNALGNEIVTPATVRLNPVLYKGSEIITEKHSGIRWYKGGTQIVSTTPDHSIDAVTNQLTIQPKAVVNLQEYRLEVVHAGKVYPDGITVLDMTDGEAFGVSIKAPTGFTFKTEADKTFNAQFYKNGYPDNTNVVFEWTLSDPDAGTSRVVAGATITVTAAEVQDYAALTLKATYGAIVRDQTETITDVHDGEDFMAQYSKSEVANPTDIPESSWKSAADAEWLNFPEGAIWMRTKKTSETAWGNAIRIKGETGNPAGGFSRNVFKISVDQPVFTAAEQYAYKDGLLPTAAGYTDSPGTPDKTLGERVWMSHGQFTLKPTATNPEALNAADWNIVGSGWAAPIQVSGVDGDSTTTQGDKGDKGWAPNIAVQTYGDKRILQLNDWVGGEGTKPSGAGQYIGKSGLTPYASTAEDVRGAKGADGVFDASKDFWAAGPLRVYSTGKYDIKFRKSKTGVVYYQGFIKRGNSATYTFSGDAYKPLTFFGADPVPLNCMAINKKGTGHTNHDVVAYKELHVAFIARTSTGHMAFGGYAPSIDLMISGSYIAKDAAGF